MKVQSLAQNGLAYANNLFDRERYTELRRIAAESPYWETCFD